MVEGEWFMKRLMALFCILTLMMVLCGCTVNHDIEDSFPSVEDEKNPDGTVTIEFYGWGQAEEQAIYQQLINEFMKEHPNIKVVYTSTSPESYMRVLQNRINNLPDVFYIPDEEFLQWADAGRLMNIDSQIAEEELADVWPEAIKRYRYDRETKTLGIGGLYALPKDLGPFAMVYNKTLFDEIVKEKGLDIEHPDPEVPMTWKEFVDLLKALKYTKDGRKIYGVTHYELATAVYSNNANFFTDDARTQRITDKNFIDAIQFIADLSIVHDVMPDADEQLSMNGFQRFSSGGAIFSFMGPWDQAGFWQNLPFEWDLIPVPVGSDREGNVTPGAKSTTWVGSMGFAISSKTKKPNAALELVKFLSIEEKSQRMNYELGQAVPNLISIAENDYLQNVNLSGQKLKPQNKKVFIDIIKGTDYVEGKARPTVYTYYTTWYSDLLTELGSVWRGEKTAEEFCNEYADVLQAALTESYESLLG